MAPEAPGNLIVIDLKFNDDDELYGIAHTVDYSPNKTEKIENAGGWFYALWNQTPDGDDTISICDGVVHIIGLPAGYEISGPSRTELVSLGNDRYAYHYPALGEGLMFVLILPENFTLRSPKPIPKSAKIFKKTRLAVYWKPKEKYGAEVKITWELGHFETDIKIERDHLNSFIDESENVPDNPGVAVDERPYQQTTIYNIQGQVGAVGPGAIAQDINFNQVWNESASNIDLKQLSEQLSQLNETLKKEATEPDHYRAIAEISEAADAAHANSGPKALEHLKKAGKWVLEKAEQLGMELAKEAMKASMGL